MAYPTHLILTWLWSRRLYHGSYPCPPEGSNHLTWSRQDQLIPSWIFLSLSETILSVVAWSSTSKEAWDTLAHVLALSSRSSILHLKDRLSNLKRGTDSNSTYLQAIKAIADDLATIDRPLVDDDLVLEVLKGLGPD